MPQAALGILLAAVSAGYIAASMLAGRATEMLGLGTLLAASLALTAGAALAQGLAPPFAGFVALAVLAGLGGGAVDAALNAFAAARFQPRHLNWLHGSWGIGATAGPAAATALLAAGFGWQAGYLLVGAALGLLALGFAATRRRWQDPAGAAAGPARVSGLSVLRNGLARRQILIFFLYTGLEAGAGQWAATVLTETRGASPAEGAAAATLFWGSIAGGRMVLGFLVDRVGADRMLRILAPVAVLAAATLALGPAGAAMPALVALGLALAPIYPTLMARTPARLGVAAARHAIGFQTAAAMLGVALLPGLLGAAADGFGAEVVAPLLLVLSGMVAGLILRLPLG